MKADGGYTVFSDDCFSLGTEMLYEVKLNSEGKGLLRVLSIDDSRPVSSFSLVDNRIDHLAIFSPVKYPFLRLSSNEILITRAKEKM